MDEPQKISVLGPKDTFSDLAAQKYLKLHPNVSATISYHKTIRKVFEDLSCGNSQTAVVPIENIFLGFVWATLDGLYDFSVRIVEEFIMPIQLSFLSKTPHSQVKTVFVNPAAEKQCLNFIEANCEGASITHTDSNIDSFERINENEFCAAVVPGHIYDENAKDYPFSVKDVSDFPNNRTRFAVLQTEKHADKNYSAKSNKTSVIVYDNSDSPGILKNIADAFASRGINMTSIISRPTKQMIGKYHFFINIDGSITSVEVSEALAEIGGNYPVKFLGCYESSVNE